MLKNYRTYIFATLIGLLSAARFLGYVDDDTFVTLLGLLNGGGLAALRSAIKQP